MALALSWTGYADTDLSFAEFAAADHSILLRFMPQFPDAYEGPFVAENGSGKFAFGMGNYMEPVDYTTRLMLMAGTQAMDYPVEIEPGAWYHATVTVAVTARARMYRVYLNGAQLGSALTVPAITSQLAQGTLRIGKRTTGQTLNGRNGQFYGLVDDVAVFTRVLSASEIASFASRAPQLTGSESDLLAGFTFQSGGRVASKLSRKTSLHGAARIVATSANRDSSADAKLLPRPTAQQLMDLPFPPGEAWSVSQGPDAQGGSHRGYACFCWDFVIADKPVDGVYPNGSDGAPFYASAPGKVLTSREIAPSGSSMYANYVEIEQAPKEICAYLHLRQNSALVAKDDIVTMGQKLALTGDTGTPVGKFHPHVAVADGEDQSAGFVTFPVAFSDYEVRTGSAWKSVARGMPKTNEVVRNPPSPLFGSSGLGVWGAVSRGPDQLDVVATDVIGRVWRAHWTPNRYAANWDRWRPVLTDVATPQTPVGLVSLDAHRLDVFIAGSDGKTYTGAWDDRVDNAVWRGWWNILTGHIPPGGAVTAVSRAAGKLDVFLVSKDGGVYTAAWDHNVADGKWRGWWRIGTVIAKPGAPVAAVARAPDKLDVFVAGIDGKTYTAAWDANVADGKWRGWWNVQTGHVPSGGTITAVARDADKLDIFLVSNDGSVYTAAWDHHAASGKWRGWWRIGTVIAVPGSPVGVVARAPDKLDIFVAGIDGKTYTAAWDANAANGTWQGWWNILTGHIHPGSAVAAVSRAPTRIDIFIVSKDQRIYTAAWDRDVNSGDWQGWWRIGP